MSYPAINTAEHLPDDILLLNVSTCDHFQTTPVLLRNAGHHDPEGSLNQYSRSELFDTRHNYKALWRRMKHRSYFDDTAKDLQLESCGRIDSFMLTLRLTDTSRAHTQPRLCKQSDV